MYEGVTMPDRRLDLERRQDAELAQVLRRRDQPPGRRTVILHLREADSRGEPHLVHAGAVFRELPKGRLPHLRPVRLGLPKPDRRKWNPVTSHRGRRQNCHRKRLGLGE